MLDAQYEKVRQGGQVLDAAVLVACGVDADGHRDVLGCSVSLSEAEVHWRSFLGELKDRGLYGLQLIVIAVLFGWNIMAGTTTYPTDEFVRQLGRAVR